MYFEGGTLNDMDNKLGCKVMVIRDVVLNFVNSKLKCHLLEFF